MKKIAVWATGTTHASLSPIQNIQNRLFFIVFGLFLAFFQQNAFAQNTIARDLQEVGYQLVVPNVVLSAGESVEVKVLVGKTGYPVADAMGFEFSIQLSAAAAASASLQPSMQASWMAEAGNALQESTSPDGTPEYTFTYERSDDVNGEGEILRFHLVAAQNDVSAASLLSQSGGVLIVDNLDFRLAAPESGLKVWPNPSSNGIFNLACDGAGVEKVVVLGLDGKCLRSFGAVDAIDLGDLATGTYSLQITNQLGMTQQRIVQLL